MRALVTLCLALLMASPAAAQFSYEPPGALVGGSGSGRSDANVYAPGMRFPIENGPAYANSQVWGVGGSRGPGGGQCDGRNYSFPWHDNYCESRSWSMPMCPSGNGHQGQDIRPATCDNNTHWGVSAASGTVTNVGSYSVYVTGDDGRRYDHLHMRSVVVGVGQRVNRGQRLGRISNAFGGTSTTIHLHFNIRMNVSGYGSVYAPTYMSLVRSYEELMGIGQCEAHCEGSMIVDTSCGQGDCAAFGARCVDDNLGVRCAFAYCPDQGSADICVDETHVGHCDDGALSQGDCGAYAAICSTAGRADDQARCVSAFCVDGPEQAPVAHDGCWINGQIIHCDADGGPSFEDCPAGTACTVHGGAPRCEPTLCPATGESTICIEDRYLGNCLEGSVVSAGDCGAFGAHCSTAGGEPQCVSALCVESPGDVPSAHEICMPDGERATCNAEGGLEDVETCEEGARCVDGVCVLGAGEADAGPPVAPGDGGIGGADAGVGGDSGVSVELSAGCSCRASGREGPSPGPLGSALLAALGLLVASRRRRRSARRLPRDAVAERAR